MFALLGWWAIPAALASVPAGQSLPAAPEALGLAPTPPPTLNALRNALETHQPVDALALAEGLLPKLRRGRTRDAVRLVVGLLHREAGRHNLASESFTRIRVGNGPLAPWGAYLEAEQDFVRRRDAVAIRECARYRDRWPEGPHAGPCQRLMAVAYAQLGDAEAARETAAEYDEEHTLGPIAEQVELALARHWLDVGDYSQAIPVLEELVVRHAAPLTGRTAERWLAGLPAEVGPRPIPQDPEAQMARAVSLRDARRPNEAWSLFEALAATADDQPDVGAFIEQEAERFGWRTRRWDFLDEYYADRYAADADPRDAWVRYRVLFRAGRHNASAKLGLAMQKAHPEDRSWRRSHEDLARTLLLAGRYDDARDQFDTVGKAGGWTGRRGRFYAAFATLMAGRHEDAIARLSAIIDEDRAWLTEARYWRARALELVGREADAAVDRAWVLRRSPNGWYAVLLRQSARPPMPAASSSAHRGRWPGLNPFPQLRFERPARSLSPVSAGPIARPSRGTFDPPAELAWPYPSVAEQAPPEPEEAPLIPPTDPPESYVEAAYWEPDEGAKALASFVRRYGRYWPELRAIEDLSKVGLYDLSGALMSDWFETWKRDYRRNRNGARRIRRMKNDDWRTLFLATRDHHHASKACYGTWNHLEEDDDPEAVRRLAYPIAHGQTVWAAAEQHDVDPFLVLGLMRQESTYKATAVSRVGARGAMQIMPRTGHLLADQIGDIGFTAADLEDPALSIRYGIRYLGLLLERFDGVYPLAVASYNGGPFNVSAWLEGTGPHLPMDAFVEHIPFRETRDYVKRVTANYDTYVRLYGTPESAVVVPPHARGDRPEVVDF